MTKVTVCLGRCWVAGACNIAARRKKPVLARDPAGAVSMTYRRSDQ